MIRSLYVRGMRGFRSVAKAAGLLGALERSSRPSCKWLRSLFSIYDSNDLAQLDLPWWTYKAISTVEQFLAMHQGQACVFEYGAGASTIWLSKRAAQVISVEHDQAFLQSMQASFDRHPNVNIQFLPPTRSSGGAGEARSHRRGHETAAFDQYVASINAHAPHRSFDLIVIDGRARVACLAAAMSRLSDNGMIVFDNSNRAEYKAAIRNCGLHVTRLRGLAPALPYPSETSILSRGA